MTVVVELTVDNKYKGQPGGGVVVRARGFKPNKTLLLVS
jgi:hypothetical protein